MARLRKAAIPDNISEEYYQISEEILSSFAKYRPPVDLFRFREDILQLYPFSRKGQRLTNEQVEEVQAMCQAGDLFVSRTDHPVYSEHIVKQIDLVLVDANLKESEVADIIIRGLTLRLAAFFDQPVLPVFETLYKDVMVLTEYLWQDKYRIRLFMRRLIAGEGTLVNRAINTGIVGLWLLLNQGRDVKRRTLDRMALGLFLHDVGLSRVPSFILGKTTPLKQEEKEKLLLHPLAGIKMLQKLNLGFDELNRCILEHHERLDGSGYPQRLRGDAITFIGRVAAVADAFGAMITKRPYAEAKPAAKAAAELAEDRQRFDASLTKLLANAYTMGSFDLPAGLNAESGTSSGSGQEIGLLEDFTDEAGQAFEGEDQALENAGQV